MKALTAALALHALFGLACLHRAVVRGEWGQSACALLVASSGVYLILGMFRALRHAEAQFERREQAEERRRVFRAMVQADHHSPQAGTASTGTAKPPAARPRP
ncbi:MAG: hypothetical protein EOP86_09605 [Verrucomicrobiaceae bacterium]|nr:MAG: hypothetical protein EOP86_09605 [Verrucomicrobiaceae bacterium]